MMIDNPGPPNRNDDDDDQDADEDMDVDDRGSSMKEKPKLTAKPGRAAVTADKSPITR